MIVNWTEGSIAKAIKKVKEIGCSDITPLIVALPNQR